jgi:membrane protein implicated in regulation of membrane protease activity
MRDPSNEQLSARIASAESRPQGPLPPSTLQVIVRYAAFQIPELIIVGCLLAVALEWELLSLAVVRAIFVLWILKDIAMFGIVREAYAPHDGRLPRDPRGSVGVAPDGIEGEAYVQLGAERWRARRAEGSSEIAPGDAFHVVELQGLTLVVEAFGDREAGGPCELGTRNNPSGP